VPSENASIIFFIGPSAKKITDAHAIIKLEDNQGYPHG